MILQTLNNVDGQTLPLNTVFNYRLIGGIIPPNHSEELFEYSFSDDYDQTGDQYTGQYKVFAKVDMTLKKMEQLSNQVMI